MNSKITKSLFSITALAGLLASPLWADTGVRTNERENVQSTAIPGERTDATAFLSVGPGLALYGGSIGWALNIGALTQLGGNPNLFYGLDTGLNFWSFPSAAGAAGTQITGATAIQVLPTMLYRFDIASSVLFPYAGVSLGPNLYLEEQTTGGTKSTQASVLFQAMLRPGFYTKLGKSVSLQVEAKMGLLRSSFIFLPQASAVFAL